MEFMYKKANKVKRQTICKVCERAKPMNLAHDLTSMYGKRYGHKFEPRKETAVEAAYRFGYEEGGRATADRIHWGPGW